MQRIAIAILLSASLSAGVIGLTTTASAALTPAEVAALHGDTYVVVSVVRSEDPSVYLMTVESERGEVVLLVSADSGDIMVGDDSQPAKDPAGTEMPAIDTDVEDADGCKQFSWVDLGFRNQGQCLRFVNTGVDTRPWVTAFVLPANADNGATTADDDETPADPFETVTPPNEEGETVTPPTEEGVEEREDCKRFQWIDLGFRNQGQCVRFVNTDVDTRPWLHPRDEEADAGEAEPDGRDACRHGGWQDLGYRNQGQCIADN
jgi:FlaG/FlaF family flagellin (archaellin)